MLRHSRRFVALTLFFMLIAGLLLSSDRFRRESAKPDATIGIQPQSTVRDIATAPAMSIAATSLPILASSDARSFSANVEPPVRDPRSRWSNPAKVVEVQFPLNFSEAVRVRSGEVDVRATPLGASANSVAEAQNDGSLIYRDAFPGCDVQYKSSLYKTEEFIIVRDKSALTDPANETGEWSWQLDLGNGASALKPRLTPAHTIELCDKAGVPRLRINAPDGKDADGRLLRAGKQLAYSVAGDRLTCRADLSGCAYPVVVDPTWSSTGTLAQSTTFEHPALRLGDGSVLVIHVDGSCERFNMSTKVWQATGSVGISRGGCSALVMLDGKVLLAGGLGGMRRCDLYDPATGAWSTMGMLNIGRFVCSMALLVDGRVLICGGSIDSGNASTIITSSELYDPGTNIWTATGNLTVPRARLTTFTLADGSVLACGGHDYNGNGYDSTERYNPTTETWSSSTMLTTSRRGSRSVALPDGRIILIGGNNPTSGIEDAEIRNPASGIWTPLVTVRGNVAAAWISGYSRLLVSGGSPSVNCDLVDLSQLTKVPTQPMSDTRGNHVSIAISSFQTLSFGSGNSTPGDTCEIYDASPHCIPQSISTHGNTAKTIVLSADSITGSVVYQMEQNPSQGTLSGIASDLTYTPNVGFLGSDLFTFKVNDGVNQSPAVSVSITVTNSDPSVFASASPTTIAVGESVAFVAMGNDPDADPLQYSWNFDNGNVSSVQNPSQSYTSVGTYTATVTAVDPFGAKETSSIVIKVGHLPVPRFTTSEVTGFAGLPLTFDASLSTDPENAVVSYSWNFGDGSPIGSGQVISRTYAADGAYSVSLTVTDADGLTSTTSRQIVILPADQVGLFNSSIEYKVKWDRSKTDADTLSVEADVNVGDAVIADGTPVAIEIAGQRFEATLDAKLRAKSVNDSWQVKANTRKQSAGELSLKFKAKKASLGLGFNQAGAVGEGEVVTLEIPLRLEIAGRVFEVQLDSSFKFSKDWKKAVGEGEGP
jgi:PKD repeat protein